jgi:hypothetical protein
MANPVATLAHLGLLIALLLCLIAPAPRAAKACLQTLERELAQAIWATLAAAGIAAPDLDDAPLIVWFNANRPVSDRTRTLAAHPTRSLDRFGRPATTPPTNTAMPPTRIRQTLDRRLPAGIGFVGWKPASVLPAGSRRSIARAPQPTCANRYHAPHWEPPKRGRPCRP